MTLSGGDLPEHTRGVDGQLEERSHRGRRAAADPGVLVNVPRAQVMGPRLVGVAASGACPGVACLDARRRRRASLANRSARRHGPPRGHRRRDRHTARPRQWARSAACRNSAEIPAVFPHPVGVRRSRRPPRDGGRGPRRPPAGRPRAHNGREAACGPRRAGAGTPRHGRGRDGSAIRPPRGWRYRRSARSLERAGDLGRIAAREEGHVTGRERLADDRGALEQLAIRRRQLLQTGADDPVERRAGRRARCRASARGRAR